jgi:hypothetical protein
MLGDLVADDVELVVLATWEGLAVVVKLRTTGERYRGALWRARRSACMRTDSREINDERRGGGDSKRKAREQYLPFGWLVFSERTGQLTYRDFFCPL